MLAVSVEFLHGTFRGDAEGAANTGHLTRGEWPPAPSRLFAALVAADGTRERCRVTDGSELEWFERLPPPVIHAHPDPWNQMLQPRFVAQHAGTFERVKRDGHSQIAVHQEYIGRSGVQIRPGVRVTPRHSHVVYSWDVEPPPVATLAALRRRAARIGYLGGADSPVRVRVMTRMPESAALEDAFTPDAHGNVMITVSGPGDVRILDRMYDAWCEHGADISRGQYPALRHEAPYRSPRSVAPSESGVVAWLLLGTAISGRRVSPVTALFKEAVLSKHQSIHGDPPAVLHGHGFSGNGYEIARYLALPDVGFQRSRGRIHGLALWMPPGSDTLTRRRVRDAAFAVRRLTGRGVDASVEPRDNQEQPVAANPSRWTRSSCRWATAFPAIHERRGTLDLAEVSRWCRHAGLPAPVAFRAARTPLVPGAVDLAPVEVNRPGRAGLPYSHVELRFAEPVRGLVVIGGGRQRGFGLCVPVDG